MTWPAGTEPLLELDTHRPLDEQSPARVVTWIPWDSGFRGSGLRVGDLIIGHADLTYGPEEVAAKIRVGDGRLSDWLRARALKPDAALTLTVLRDDATQRIEGRLGGPRRYVNGQGQRTLGDKGPVMYEKDGFEYAWEAWYGQFVDLARTVLGGWDYYVGISSKALAEQVAPLSPRVAYLQQHYPGAFSRAVQDDYGAMQVMVAGEERPLTAADLAYRRLGDIRATEVTAAADRAFAAFLSELDGSLLKNAPVAPNPFLQDVRPLVGALIRLPPLTRRDVLYETRRSWYWSGRDGGGYLVDRMAASLSPLHTAEREYTETVDPAFRDESIQFVGTIDAEPALVCDVDRHVTVTGVRMTPRAALVSNANHPNRRFFVDLRSTRTEAFAGKTALEADIERPKLDDAASAERVLQVAFEALKIGDMETWLSCYANWKVNRFHERDGFYEWVDRTWVTMSEMSGATTWDKARQRLLDDVYGLEVARVGRPRVVFDAARQPVGHTLVAPEPRIVEEVQAVVNHIGLTNGAYRTFAGPLLHRQWSLQRLDGGPWRITVSQAI